MPRRARATGEPLTGAELEVLCLTALGLDPAQGADRMHVTKWVFKEHLKVVYAKLGAENGAHAVQLGYTHGWLRLAAPRPEPADPLLPEQPRNVLKHAAMGKQNTDIARILWISHHTVKTQIARAYDKLGARNRAHAVHLGFTTGNLRLGPVPHRPDGRVP